MEPLSRHDYRSPDLPPPSSLDDPDDDPDNEASRMLSQPPLRTSTSSSTSPLDPQNEFRSLYPYTLIFVFAFAVAGGLSSALVDVPEVRLFEMALCRDYYRGKDPSVIGPPPLSYVDEELCKVDSVQVELAYIMATRSLLGAIPGILLTFPYGHLAGRIGRRTVLRLGMLGQVLEYFWVVTVCYFHEIFPTRLVLLSPVFTIIGGGSKVVAALVAVIITDVTPESKRTRVFYLVNATMISSAVVAMPFGSFLLSIDLWLPYKLDTVLTLIAFSIAFALPETLRKRSPIEGAGEEGADIPRRTSSMTHRLRATLLKLHRSLAALNPFTVPKQIILLLLLLFLTIFTSMTGRIVVQYASKRLDLSVSTAGYILGVRVFVGLPVLFCLAFITRIFEKNDSFRPFSLDIWIVRFSFVALTVGTAFVGMSGSAVVFTIGTVLTAFANGLVPAMQSLLAHFADKGTTADVFAGAALVELLAEFSGGFAFAGLFDLGTRGGWFPGIGLPFYASAVLTLFAGALSFWLPNA